MSNTVRRPRKRPRAGSCAWKTFGWLLRRAVAVAAYEGAFLSPVPRDVRIWFGTASAALLARYVATVHVAHPHSRFTREFHG